MLEDVLGFCPSVSERHHGVASGSTAGKEGGHIGASGLNLGGVVCLVRRQRDALNGQPCCYHESLCYVEGPGLGGVISVEVHDVLAPRLDYRLGNHGAFELVARL